MSTLVRRKPSERRKPAAKRAALVAVRPLKKARSTVLPGGVSVEDAAEAALINAIARAAAASLVS